MEDWEHWESLEHRGRQAALGRGVRQVLQSARGLQRMGPFVLFFSLALPSRKEQRGAATSVALDGGSVAKGP